MTDPSRPPPVHPGEILLEEFLEPMEISQYRLAREISVPPTRISEIVHGKRGVSPDTALRLARYFGTLEGFWLDLQARFDLETEKARLGNRLDEEVLARSGGAPRHATHRSGSASGDDPDRVVVDLADRFFEISIDMFCFADFSGYFRWVNPAWRETVGFTLQEMRSRPFIEFVHPDDRESTLEQNRRVREGGMAVSFENRYLCKDGSYKWLLWNAAPDFEHRVIYSAARDITQRKTASEEREALVAELQDALAEVRMLREILPICSYCKRIRDDDSYWQTVEQYISRHTNTRFSHGICPECYTKEFESELGALGDE